MDWLSADADEVAPALLGMRLATRVDGAVTSVSITEVEAYLPDDPASHAFRGRTPRNTPMFEGPGIVYVYRSYGLHWCVNVVTGRLGSGQAVLVRAGLPLEGTETMIERRGRPDHLADGPGKLCQALGIDAGFNGTRLGERLELSGTPGTSRWFATSRIGISAATEQLLRFVASPGAG
jgi:DNA-3-methyladenine glycosylase